jgi:hypothetical protein
VRGADAGGGLTGLNAAEQSPRARGRFVEGVQEIVRLGAIPACTESASGSGTLARPTQSYPRLRGADYEAIPALRCITGLSPPAWGRLDVHLPAPCERGAIPRVCGPTAVSTRWYTARRSYPRVRWADVMLPPPYTALKELSLSARRRLAVAVPLVGLAGAIPACAGPIGSANAVRTPVRELSARRDTYAGLTRPPTPSPRTQEAIPTCAADQTADVMPAQLTELSPHGRGQRPGVHAAGDRNGAIPACTGPTLPAGS